MRSGYAGGAQCYLAWSHHLWHKTPVEQVNSFKFLGVHITEELTWSAHTDAVLKKAHQRLFFLRRLRKFGNSTAGNCKALQRVVRTARHIVGGELPSLQDIYTRRCTRKARRIIKDSSHPSHRLLSLLPSGRCLRSIRSALADWGTAFSPRLSGQWTVTTNSPYITLPLPLYNMPCTAL